MGGGGALGVEGGFLEREQWPEDPCREKERVGGWWVCVWGCRWCGAKRAGVGG